MSVGAFRQARLSEDAQAHRSPPKRWEDVLVEMAEERDTPEGPVLGIGSNGAWFPLGPAGIHLA